MRKTSQRLLTAFAVPSMAAALLIGSASPASALSVNVSVGGSPASSAGAHSATNVTGNPTAANHRTTISLGQPVQAQGSGVSTPAVTASLDASGQAAQSGDLSGAADLSVAAFLQNAGSAAVIGGGNLDGSDLDSDPRADLNLSLGNGFAGDGPSGPGTPSATQPSGSAGTSGSAGSASGGGSANGAGSASGSAGSSGVSGSGNFTGSGSATPGSTIPGTTQNPVVTVPCTSNELLDALVVITADGVAQVVDAANGTGVLNGTVIAKPTFNTCTISLNVDANGDVNLDTTQSDFLKDLSIGDGEDLLDGVGGTGGVSLVEISTDETADGLSVDLTVDDADETPLLSVK